MDLRADSYDKVGLSLVSTMLTYNFEIGTKLFGSNMPRCTHALNNLFSAT